MQPSEKTDLFDNIRLTETWLIALCIALGAAQCWICRYTMLSDGMSYMDIGDAYFRGDWAAAINAYWSPLYSWFLGLAQYLLKPSIWWEFPVVHLVNFIIYLGALFSFRFFLHAVLRSIREQCNGAATGSVSLPETALLALGYGVFLWCGLVPDDVGRATPDLLVAGILFLMMGCLVELQLHPSYRKCALFGALNGAAYLGKAIMFPLAFGFLAILFFSRKRSKTTIYGVLLAFITFLAVSSPFIYALSRAKGRFTTGETGKLAYSAMVNGSEQIHWQGEPPGSGIPLHTTRKLLDSPPIFEFAEPIRGTYPPWDDPSYWNEGTRWTFRLRSQIRVLLQSALAYEKLVLDESGLLAGAFIFLFLGGSKTRKGILQNWPLLAAAGLSLAAYSFVLVIPRYVGGSLVVFWVAIFAGVRLPNASLMLRNSKYVAAAVSLTVIFSAMANIGDSAYKQWTVTVDPSSKDQVMAAVGLQAMGLRGGDEVAVIGRGFVNHWARLGHFRIVAEAVAPGLPAREFWAAPAERRELAYQCLKSTGARVVVAWDPPASAKSDARWHHIPGSDFYAFFLSQ